MDRFFFQPPKWIIDQVSDVPQATSRPPEAEGAGCRLRISFLCYRLGLLERFESP
jgi:hypothetical protein